MSSEHRAIILTNDNPNITYLGDWTSFQANTVNNLGNFGPAYSPTLHGTTSNSRFSLSFQGSSITVFGTINIANKSSNPDPTWKCSVDSISLESNLFPFPENNWGLCSSSNIPDGAHELVVNVTSDGTPFYLDYIEYRSSSDVSLENSLIFIDNSDPAIDYISGWSSLGETANMTADPKGLVNVTFIGVQLSWYGFIPVEESHNASSGEYSIDGGLFTPFQLAGLSQTTTSTLFNQPFFITPTLDMGTHVLSVKYTGISGLTPLTLDYLIVMNGSFPPSSTSSSAEIKIETETHASSLTQISSPIESGIPTSPPKPSINSSSSNDKSSLNVGAITGGVVGFVIGVVMIIFLVWFKFYRKRNQEPPYEIMPFPHQSISISPLQTSQTPKNHTRQEIFDTTATVVPSEYPSSDSVNPTLLFANGNRAFLQTQNSPLIQEISGK